MKFQLPFPLLSLGIFLHGRAVALESNPEETPQLLSELCNSRTDGRSECEVELDVPSSCVPTNAESDPSCPIVVFLHGSGGTNNWFAKTTGVHSENLIGIYPQGEKGWNTGPKDANNCEWDDYNCASDPDEGGFIAEIIDEVRNQGATGRVYVIGNSNGAALAHRLGANAGDDLPISGIVTKVTQLLEKPDRSGPGVLNYNKPTEGGRQVSVLNVMGTDDKLIPYLGGISAVFSRDEDFVLMSSDASMIYWATHNGCNMAPDFSTHTTDQGDGEAIFHEYNECDGGHIVEHYAIVGGGHNAGGATIDGEKIDYVVAYAFIARVEQGLDDAGEGTPPAPSPPVTPPAPSPPFPNPSPNADVSCVDSVTWQGKFNSEHTCEYVALDPEGRCRFQDSNLIKAQDACEKTCDNCSTTSTPPPIPSPTVLPCINDASWQGKYNSAHTCDYVAEDPNNRCRFEDSNGIKAEDVCPAACDENCSIEE